MKKQSDPPEKLVGELLTPLVEGGWTIGEIRLGASVDIPMERDGSKVTLWLQRAAEGQACYRVAGPFLVGYRGAWPAIDDLRRLDAFCDQLDQAGLNEDDLALLFRDVARSAQLRVMGDHGRLELELGLGCNERCPFCSVNAVHGPVEVDGAAVRDTLAAAADRGINHVSFSGGEPTMYAELPRWVERAKRLGMAVLLQTNGLIPGKPGYWDSFRVLPDRVLVSFHTTHPKRVGVLTGVEGTFERKVRAVQEAMSRGIRVDLNWVISTLNLEETPGLPDFAERTFGRKIGLVLSVMAPTGRAVDRTDLLPPLPAVASVMERALDQACRLGLDVRVLDECGVPPCVLPGHAHLLDALRRPSHDLRLSPEQDLPYHLFKPDSCASCYFNDRCVGIWRQRDGSDRKLLKPFSREQLSLLLPKLAMSLRSETGRRAAFEILRHEAGRLAARLNHRRGNRTRLYKEEL